MCTFLVQFNCIYIYIYVECIKEENQAYIAALWNNEGQWQQNKINNYM